MALRELLFEVGFKGNASDILKMDSAVDDLKSNASDAISDVNGLESATASLGQETEKSGNIISDNWKEISVGLLATGAAVEGLARKNQSMEVSLKKLSAQTGESTDALREMAIETSNVTFPLDEVIALMETGRKQGLKSAEQLQEYANFWDLVGDATGESGVALAESSSALRALGIEVGNESQAINAFGYLTENTTQDIGEFLKVIERSAPDIKEMGLSVDETAALMGAMEKQGITGRTAMSQFTKAVNSSDGDMEKLIENLGISTSEFEAEKRAVEESTEILQRNADFVAESFTATQRLTHGVSELTLKYGEQIKVLSNLTPLISTIGPITKGASSAIDLMGKFSLVGLKTALVSATTTVWGFTAALLANPITWVVVGIMALIAAVVLLWKNWESVTDWIVGAINKVGDVVGSIVDWIVEKFEWLNPIQLGKNIITGLVDGLLGGIKKIKDAVGKVTNAIGGGIKKFFGINSPSKLMIEYGVNINEGLSEGMDKSKDLVEVSSEQVSQSITPKIDLGNELSDINSASKLMVEHGVNIEKDILSGIDNSKPRVESSNEQTSQSVTPTATNRTETFAPTINITVNGGTRETVNVLKAEWEKLMAQYNKRQSLGVV